MASGQHLVSALGVLSWRPSSAAPANRSSAAQIRLDAASTLGTAIVDHDDERDQPGLDLVSRELAVTSQSDVLGPLLARDLRRTKPQRKPVFPGPVSRHGICGGNVDKR